MDSSSQLPDPKALHRVVWVSATVLLAGGMLVLCGWEFRIPLLRGDFRGTNVAPLTAASFVILAATSLLATVAGPWFRTRVWLARLLLVLVLGVALQTIWEYIIGYYHPYHALFFAHRMDDWRANAEPGRYSLPAAIGLTFATTSALAYTFRLVRVGFALAVPVGVVAYFALIGHLYDIEVLYGYVMALTTAMLFLVVYVLLDAQNQDSGLFALLFSKGPGGVVFRQITPLIFLIVPAIGAFRVQMQNFGVIPTAAGTAGMVIVITIVFLVVSVRIVRMLDQLDSERERAVGAIQQTEKLAVAGRLASTVAHEINNPLEAIVNLVYLLRTEPGLSYQAREYVRIIEQELARVSHMTRRTLGFYREASTPVVVPLSEIARETAEIYGSLAARRGVNLNLELEADVRVFAVPAEIRQIVLNVLVNAVEAAPPLTGIVTARTRAENSYGVLEVEDNGVGIPVDLQPQIFKPFFTTKNNTGTGIGLWVSRQLAEKSHGDLEFESYSGRTVFRLRLPLEPAAAIASD